MDGADKETGPFVQNLSRALRKRDLRRIQELYEDDYPAVSQSYYKSTAWPTSDKLSAFLEDDNVKVLYDELYFRHKHTLSPSLDDRLDSFQNYIDLFNIILGLTPDDPELILPNAWLWDLIEGFVQQFSSFHQYRTNLKALSPAEISQLKETPHVWSPQTVIGYLNALIKKSGVDIARPDRTEEVKNIAPMFRTLSDLSIIGLSQVLCTLCDYTTSLSVLEHLSTKKNSSVTSVWGAHLSLVYHMSFSLVMLRRYREAVLTLTDYLDEEERMLGDGDALRNPIGVLGLAVGLQPQVLSDVLMEHLRSLHGWQSLEHRQPIGFELIFTECCPKFINPSLPNYDSGRSTHEDAFKQQLRIFKTEVEHRSHLPGLYEYLKMCNSVSLQKLGSFVKSEESSIAARLLALKIASAPVPRLAGAPALPPDPSDSLDFYIDRDMVHVGELVRNVNYGKTFIRKILKLEDITEDIRRLGRA